MKIIAGLGNPGREYQGTRHNVGFMLVDEVARQCGMECGQRKFKSLFGSGQIGGERCVILKPQTYMNLSGEAIWPVLAWFQIGMEDLLVVCDDFHRPIGKLRIRRGGGSGGHKGLGSIIESLGSDEFPRLRIGIGEAGQGDPRDFVLSRFEKDESETMEGAVRVAVSAVETWIREGLESCMNKFNG